MRDGGGGGGGGEKEETENRRKNQSPVAHGGCVSWVGENLEFKR